MVYVQCIIHSVHLKMSLYAALYGGAHGHACGMRGSHSCMRTILAYIDDILILAESKEMALDHETGLVYLMENLGFVVNKTKCQLEPAQKLSFWVVTQGRQVSIKRLSQHWASVKWPPEQCPHFSGSFS